MSTSNPNAAWLPCTMRARKLSTRYVSGLVCAITLSQPGMTSIG